jgi:NADH-quinone oxidoreductase subunit N
VGFTWQDAGYFWPETIMALTFLACVGVDLIFRGRHALTVGVLIGGCVLSLAAAVLKPPVGSHEIFGQMVVVDPYAHFFRFLFLLITLITALFSYSSREIMGRDRENQGEYYSFLAIVCFGMMIMAEASDLLMLALSIELVSVTSYILAGFARFSLRSSEASLKYVLWGAVSSGLMLYGASWLYGLTGETSFGALGTALMATKGSELTILVAVLFLMAGIGYKISAVPFHFWTPDVYEGAPTPVTAFFAAGPKAAGFALMIRFFYTALVQPQSGGAEIATLTQLQWPWVLGILSAVTMTWGNLAAVRQENVKRLLAYSSIAHVGYLLMGFVLLTESGLSAIMFYLLVYALMNLGAFLVVIALNNRLNSENIEDYAGLGYREPLLAGSMTLFLFSLTGLPPTAGFIGKFYLFAAAGERGLWWLAILGVLNSVVSLYYYMRIVKTMYFTRSAESGGLGLATSHMALIALLAVPTFVLGLFWGPLKTVTDSSLAYLFGG